MPIKKDKKGVISLKVNSKMDSTTRTIYILGAIVLLLFAGVLLLHSPARTTIIEANTTVPEAILAQEVPEVPQEEEPAPPSTVAPERVVIETSKGNNRSRA